MTSFDNSAIRTLTPRARSHGPRPCVGGPGIDCLRMRGNFRLLFGILRSKIAKQFTAAYAVKISRARNNRAEIVFFPPPHGLGTRLSK